MNILVEQLEAMAVAWPAPEYDVEEQRQRLQRRGLNGGPDLPPQ